MYTRGLVPLIFSRIKNERGINNISKLCRAVIQLSYFFKHSNMNEMEIVDFCFYLFKMQNINYQISDPLKNCLLSMQNNIQDNIDDPYFYKDSPELCLFLAKLMAYSLIEQPICILGPPGIGKTSSARNR